MNANLFDRLERSIADLTSTAITTPAGETVSYADLIALSGRLANVLAARGVKPGQFGSVIVTKGGKVVAEFDVPADPDAAVVLLKKHLGG